MSSHIRVTSGTSKMAKRLLRMCTDIDVQSHSGDLGGVQNDQNIDPDVLDIDVQHIRGDLRGRPKWPKRLMPDALDIDVRYVRMTTGVSKIIKMLIRMCR